MYLKLKVKSNSDFEKYHRRLISLNLKVSNSQIELDNGEPVECNYYYFGDRRDLAITITRILIHDEYNVFSIEKEVAEAL